jgi:hypothetical protein
MLIVDPETNETHSPRPGEIYKNPYLASVFRDLAEQGKKGFYEGRVAEAIVERAFSCLLFPLRSFFLLSFALLLLLIFHTTSPLPPASLRRSIPRLTSVLAIQ